MPSYYDSTKKKPGKAKLKYNEGGTVKKMSDGWDAYNRDVQAKKELQESINRLRREGKFHRMSEADRAARNAREQAAWDAEYDKAKAKSRATGNGGKVKKMKGGGTVARGSGAARPQAFHKNG